MYLKVSLDHPDHLDPRLDHHLELAQLLEVAHHFELDLGHHLVWHHYQLLINLILDLAH